MLARFLLVVLAGIVATQSGIAAQTRWDGMTEEEVAAFLGDLQAAVRADKPAAVADLIVFPLRVNKPALKGFVRTRGEFLRSYASIFTPEVRTAILKQTPSELFRNWQGFMIGNGEIWFNGVCRDASCSTHRIGVITANVTNAK
jgi:hypothetical protein